MRKYRLNRQARKEYLDALNFYADRSEIVAQNFRNQFNKVIDLIVRYPEAGTVFESSVRRILTSRFPYSIYYHFNDELISIIAVFHQHRDPELINKRL